MFENIYSPNSQAQVRQRLEETNPDLHLSVTKLDSVLKEHGLIARVSFLGFEAMIDIAEEEGQTFLLLRRDIQSGRSSWSVAVSSDEATRYRQSK